MQRRTKQIIFTFLFILTLPVYALAQAGDTITVTVTLAQAPGVLVAAPPDKTANPGEIVIYNFTVQNVSNASDRYRLSITSSQGWGPVIPGGNNIGPLAPGQIAQVFVRQRVPKGALPATQDLLTLRAVSWTNSNIFGSDSVLTTVNQIADVNINLLPKIRLARSGETVPLSARITNRGNGSDSFKLTAASSLGWRVEFPSGDTVGPLEPNIMQTIPVRVIVPQNARRGQRNRVTITAASQFNPAVSDSSFSTLIVR